MSSRSTNTYKESMSSLEVNDSVNLGNMGNGIFEKNQIHFDELWLHVVLLEHVVEMSSKLFELSDFNVW